MLRDSSDHGLVVQHKGCIPADGAGQAQCQLQLAGKPERMRQHVLLPTRGRSRRNIYNDMYTHIYIYTHIHININIYICTNNNINININIYI